MAVALGENFLVAVNQFGVVLTCGQNESGQLGVGLPHGVDTYQMQRISLGNIKDDCETNQRNVMVSAGYKHAAFVTRSGSVYTWGSDVHGQLGVGVVRQYFDSLAASRLAHRTGKEHVFSQPIPRLAYSTGMGGSRAIMVACGREYTLLLTASGHVWGCGSNQYFQIGVQNMDDPLQSRNRNRNITVFTMMPAARFNCGDGDPQIAFIAAGSDHSIAVGRNNGLLWTWGKGFGGKLGHGDGGMDHYALVPTHLPQETFGEAVVSACASDETSMAVTASGALWVCGYSFTGKLGLGDVLHCNTFKRVDIADGFGDGGVRSVTCSAMHALIVSHDGSVRMCGHTVSRGQNYMVPTLIDPACFNNEPVVLVSAGGMNSVAVTASGRLYTWGEERRDEYCGLACTHEFDPSERMIQMSPRQVQHIDLFGLWHYPLSDDEMLAFAMGTHLRLGMETCFQTVPEEVLECIRGSSILPGASLFGVGLRNLLGI